MYSIFNMKKNTLLVFTTAAALCIMSQARAELSAEELAKLAQNPVANLISVPIQNNTNFNVGPLDGTQNVMNIQPVIPVTVNKDWNLITRTILPVIHQPQYAHNQGNTDGIGDIQFSAFLSPSDPGPSGLIWGAGAITQAPTNTNKLGNDNWGLGPSLVVLRIQPGNPWVYGALVNNLWSLTDDNRGGEYNNFLIQPFINYNFKGGFYLNTVPIITANWKADKSSDTWTVPLGMGVGKIFHIGKLPLNVQAGYYNNVIKPDNGPDWQLRLQAQVMFPK